MVEQIKQETEKKKSFWQRLMDKLDNKMEKKAKSSSCCGGSHKEKDSSSC